jgi:hypothetical protein
MQRLDHDKRKVRGKNEEGILKLNGTAVNEPNAFAACEPPQRSP